MLNKVILIGRLTKDVEMRYTQQTGVAVGNFTLAVDRGTKEKETDFIRIVVWEKQAENCAQYIGKGSLVAVEGRLQIRNYEDKEGNKRIAAEVVAFAVKFLDKRKSDDSGGYDRDDGTDITDEDSVPF